MRSERTFQGISTRALGLAHRIVPAPGGGAPDEIVAECCRQPLEKLARRTLKG